MVYDRRGSIFTVCGIINQYAAAGMVSQLADGVASYTDVQNPDLPEPIQGNTELQDEMSDAWESLASESKFSRSADVTGSPESADGRSSFACMRFTCSSRRSA